MAQSLRTQTPPQKFDSFWHLQAIGLLEPTSEPLPAAQERVPTEIWGKLEGTPEALVALIDTGVSAHPYLEGKLKPVYLPQQAFNVDLTGTPALARPETKPGEGVFGGIDADLLSGLGLFPKSKPGKHHQFLKDLVAKFKDKYPFNLGAPLTANQKFAAHGTSCAGLVVASSEDDPRTDPVKRPYYRGVCPRGGKILSITTSFSPRPEMLILAFLLAAANDAQVILFPRGLPREIMDKDPDLQLEQRTAWAALKETILQVSKRIPVVCAAGNECNAEAIAPACFADKSNGIIGVAAMNHLGWRSSYGNFGPGVTLAAPSDDAEMFNSDQARLDKSDRFYFDYPYEPYIENHIQNDHDYLKVDYSEASIRAIDVPGPFGFSDADTPENVRERIAKSPESYFTQFGGTSAAASIVAGVAALMQRAALKKYGKALDGVNLRGLMVQAARGADESLPHLPSQKLKVDKVSSVKEDGTIDRSALTFEKAFGAGLVDAKKAVLDILGEGAS